MATKVKTNMGAIRSLNTLNKNARAAQKNLRKVATGERITSAADDASAWGISERMREKIRSLDQANDNAQNDLAMMRTAEGAVANIVDILRTLKQKAIDSANDSNTDEDRRIMQKEVDQLLDQIDDNALVTFNGKFLVNGQMSGIPRMVGAVWYCEGLYAFDEMLQHLGAVYYTQTQLTNLTDRNNNNLGIEETDTYTVTHVVNGRTYSRTKTVGSQTLGNVVTGNRLSIGNRYTEYYSDPDWSLSAYDPDLTTEEFAPNAGMIFSGNHIGTSDEVDILLVGVNYVLAGKDGKPVKLPEVPAIRTVVTASLFKDYQLSGFNITIRDAGGNKESNIQTKRQSKCHLCRKA